MSDNKKAMLNSASEAASDVASEIKKATLEAMVDMLNKEEFKDAFLKEINDSIDIPIINEKKEGKIFKALYKILVKIVEKQVAQSE